MEFKKKSQRAARAQLEEDKEGSNSFDNRTASHKNRTAA